MDGVDAENAAAVSSLGKSSQLSGRRVWVEKWFRFLLQQYKADEDIEIPLAKITLFFHFLILAVSISGWNGFEDKYLNRRTPLCEFLHLKLSASNTVDLIARVLIGALMFLTVSLFALGYWLPTDISSKPSTVIYICSGLKYLHWYIVMPCCFMMFSRDLFGVQVGIKSSKSASSWLLILAGLVLYASIIYMRSQLPSSCKFNSPNRLAEAGISLIYFILICANKNMTSEAAYSVFEIISIVIHIFGVSIAWQTQIFWWNGVNTFYMLGHLFICVGRISFKVFDLAFGSNISMLQLLVFTAVFETISLRLGHTYGIFRLVRRMKNCQHASNIDNFILFFTYDLCKQAADDKLGEQIPAPLLFEMSQIGRLSLYAVKRRQFLLNADQRSNTGTQLNRDAGSERMKLLNASFESECSVGFGVDADLAGLANYNSVFADFGLTCSD